MAVLLFDRVKELNVLSSFVTNAQLWGHFSPTDKSCFKKNKFKGNQSISEKTRTLPVGCVT